MKVSKQTSLSLVLGAILAVVVHAGCDAGAGGAKDGGGSTASSSGGTTLGSTSSGTSGTTGSASTSSGATGSSSSSSGQVTPGSYALNPPRQCDNQFYVQGCQQGMASSACGGQCVSQNACEGQKQGNPDIGFLCPRFMLFSDEMGQAVLDDGDGAFGYAVAGHDVDTGGLDQGLKLSCCQCYQLVYDLPENEAQVGGNGPSAIPVPKPLIVQSFNTAAGGPQNFDVFMGAGGFGAFNACSAQFGNMPSPSGQYLYTEFPPDGEPGSGGENAITQIAGCRDTNNLATTATLSSSTCQAGVAQKCGQFASGSATVTQESIQSCVSSNAPTSYYHLNWHIYAKRVECPAHLTEVTGCKLAPQGLPSPDPSVTTASQAAADPSFRSGYTTTTMQDCCKPTCAWQDNVTGPSGGETAVGLYNSFYTCDKNGVPVTE